MNLLEKVVNTIRVLGFYSFFTITSTYKSSDEAWVQACYKGVLRRTPDEDGLKNFISELQKKNISRPTLIALFSGSEEYKMRKPLNWEEPSHHLHQSRVEAVKLLPPAETILDLGGAHSRNILGALVDMGYPHQFKEITIIDWPPEERFFKTTIGHLEKNGKWIKSGGYKIKYLHQNMLDLRGVADKSIDMIWCGQSVEHITQKEFKKLLDDSKRVLTKDGYFCFDTPNRLITKIEMPNSWVNPDHKYEYTPKELRDLLKKHNYKIVKEVGERPLPNIYKTKKFDYQEVVKPPYLSDNLDICYFVLFVAQVNK